MSEENEKVEAPEKEDHDQRFKKALKDNFPDFIKMFYPQYFDAIDFDSVKWKDKELYIGEPEGDKVVLDTVAHIKTKVLVDLNRPDQKEWYVIVHVEIESRESTDRIDARIIYYYMMLMFEFGVPILPVVLFIKMTKDGIGRETLVRQFFTTKVLEFTYDYVALGGLDPLEYLKQEFPLGWALTSLMNKGKHNPIEIGKQAVEKLNEAKITDLNRIRLKAILESYLQGSEQQKQEVMRMWRIDPAPKLIPDNESNLDRFVRESKEREAHLKRERDEAEARLKRERDEAEARLRERNEAEAHLKRERDEAEAGRAEAESKSRRDSIKRLIEKRFGLDAAQMATPKIDSITNMDKLNLLFDEAISVASVDELRKLLA